MIAVPTSSFTLAASVRSESGGTDDDAPSSEPADDQRGAASPSWAPQADGPTARAFVGELRTQHASSSWCSPIW